eukprot:scaffold97832_cov65-Phaeocystis_antarctica.AAC.4
MRRLDGGGTPSGEASLSSRCHASTRQSRGSTPTHRLSSHAAPATERARCSGEVTSADEMPSAEKRCGWRDRKSSSSAPHSTRPPLSWSRYQSEGSRSTSSSSSTAASSSSCPHLRRKDYICYGRPSEPH